MTFGEQGLERVLNGIEAQLKALSMAISHLDDKLDGVRLNYVSKEEYQASRRIIRTVTMWAIGIMVTLGVATWTIIASRPEIILETGLVFLTLKSQAD